MFACFPHVTHRETLSPSPGCLSENGVGTAWWAAWALVAVSALLLLLAWVRVRPSAELTRNVHEIARDLDGLSEHVTRMETRARVRKMRDSREPAAEPTDPQQLKAQLRARLRGANGGA